MTTESTKPTRQRRWPRGEVQMIARSLFLGKAHTFPNAWLAKAVSQSVRHNGGECSCRRVEWRDPSKGAVVTLTRGMT